MCSGVFQDNIILSLLFSIPYIYEISKTHFYWQFCHPTFSFVVGILFCSHYLLFWMEVGGYLFSFLWIWTFCFSLLVCTEIWIWIPIGDFWWVVLSVFFRKGNPCGFFIPSEGQSLCSIHKISLFLTKWYGIN